MFPLDVTGFPYVPIRGLGLAVGLFPVTRVQFEYYLGAPTGFPPSAYAELDAASPRAGWRAVPADHPERVFLAAVRPEEVEAVAAWAGEGFRLPTEAEWRTADEAFARAAVADIARLIPPTAHPAARALAAWSAGRRPATGRAFALFEGGLMEWVRRPDLSHGLHGRPRPGLLAVVHNPQVHPALRPRTDARHPAFGARLVRPLPPNRGQP